MKHPFNKTTISGDWFYMNSHQVSVRSIHQCLLEDERLTLEVWEDAGVLEVTFNNKSSLDFEMIKPYFKDKEGDEYLKKNDIHTLYMVTFQASDYDLVLPLMKAITKNLGGFFCEDTYDFSNLIH